jgi:hypothetical protein
LLYHPPLPSLCRRQLALNAVFLPPFSVHSSGFTFATDAFRGFAKGAFDPFFAASLPGGLVANFLASFLGTVGACGRERVAAVGGREYRRQEGETNRRERVKSFGWREGADDVARD